MKLVKYVGCTDEQANWGSGRDPRKYLDVGEIYELEDVEVHSWYTLFYVKDCACGFNSICFEEVTPTKENEDGQR